MVAGGSRGLDSRRKERKELSCMVSVGERVVCIDPSIPILHLLGKKHTSAIIVVIGNSAGKRNFNEILNDIPFSSSTIIAGRLKELVRSGIVSRNETAEGISYSLTPMGSELRKIMIELFSYLDRK